MPTDDPHRAISFDEAFQRAGELAFVPATPGQEDFHVGLEPELFPILVDDRGGPAGRMALEGEDGVIATVDALAGCDDRIAVRQGPAMGPWEYPLAGGGRLTFEPGAQVEHSTAVHPTAREALEDVQDVLDRLRSGFRSRGAVLAAVGSDLWHSIKTVPQQLRAARYTAMAAYYDLRSPLGRIMMRHTATLQINLDLGGDGVWQERWLLANLLSPLVTASFACSPGSAHVSTRAHAWQVLDPTRTGFPDLLVDGSGDNPRHEWGEAALAADVLLFRLGGGRAEPGEPGRSFASWISDGHALFGWPTADDLDYHLSTLFLEVRPRGFFELRACDALPDNLRAAPVVLLSALFYSDQARSEALAALTGICHRLPEVWRRAAIVGIRDPELGALAATIWEIAIAAAERMPDGYFGAPALTATRSFLDRYVQQARMPGDDLIELQAQDSAQALDWATGVAGAIS